MNNTNHFSDNLLLMLNEKRFKNILTNEFDENNQNIKNYSKDKYFKFFIRNRLYKPENSIYETFNNLDKNLNTISKNRQGINQSKDEIDSLKKEINDRQLDINYYKLINYSFVGVIAVLFGFRMLPRFR
tara:strand:- start:220 stop:606 length:387 start_codon:yes stop_codon:yes gene_type:complete